MKFLRRNRFNILIAFLILVFIIVSFYMLWVHVPYSRHKNDLAKIENEIIAENGYDSADYFNRYDGEKSYYIIHAKKGEKQQYAVFDEKKKFIKSYSGDVVDQQECIDAFKEKYKQTPDDVEIGYENEIFVYSLLYRGEDSLIYAFYGIDSGEFIKAYRIDNSR
ncbi:hypothetical protein LI094_01060 [[Clostridium] saccharogumia]|uniref:hypothetical protein n=1 Tax=Thomasclavelia saccharogumia TaxID=341225 RepID=UPI001D06017C|nr:hypothetical protein [Thomasclavelia saccharogumia]MCB6705116.1 hypothetical protein [Thomasclavelia saccharogumia]